MKKIGIGFLLIIGVLIALVLVNPQINPSHTSPFLALDKETTAPAPAEADIVQRVILYGDAGHSSREPWQASMLKVAQRASIAPDKSTVVALGDNIYMQGYPQKEEDQTEWDEDQLESISFLDAQLRVAKESGADMYLVPGNHDWYATELQSQSEHVARYAEQHGVNTRFEPFHGGDIQYPTAAELPGVTLIFIDSEWLLRAEGTQRSKALGRLDLLMRTSRKNHPDKLLLLTAHHPLETMGQHAGYLAEFAYWFFIKTIFMVFPEAADEDTYSPIYQAMITDINAVTGKYERVIYAAGHEHSLQVFHHHQGEGTGPEYSLVSGAANSNKISGVWHTPNTRFALSQEGFMELSLTNQGTYLQVWDIHNEAPVAGFWLAL